MERLLLIGIPLLWWLQTTQATMVAQSVDTAPNSTALWAFIRNYHEHHHEQLPELEYDQAWLTLNVSTGFAVQVWAQSHRCWKCPIVYVTEVAARTTTTIVVNTTAVTDIKFARKHPGGYHDDICSFTIKFRERGDYWLFMDYETAMERKACSLLLANDPLPAEMPILYMGLGLVGLVVLFVVWSHIRSYLWDSQLFKKEDESTESNVANESSNDANTNKGTAVSVENGQPPVTPATPVAPVEKKKPRLRSLDTFRGFTMVVMLFVNSGGGGYWFFEHLPWNGLTVADLVFPWFIFIMGTSMTFSFRSMYRREMTGRSIVMKIVSRSFKLFALGILLNTNRGPVDLAELRIPGVLQRFGFTYLVAALIHLCFYRNEDSHQDRKWAAVRDLILYLPEWLVHFGLLALYMCLTYLMPVPNCPTGYTGPGGLSEGGKYKDCTGGAARYIDAIVLGENHIFHYPTTMELYQTEVPFDPEGILGTLTSIFLCFLGIQSGRILVLYQEHKGRIVRWLVWGAITGGIAAVLCWCSQDDGWIPFNKNIWSLSYILVTASFAFFLLTIFYVINDVLDWWGGQPFIYPGMNSIVVYFCDSIFFRVLPLNWLTEKVHWKMLLIDSWGAVFWIIVSYILFRKKIFVAL